VTVLAAMLGSASAFVSTSASDAPARLDARLRLAASRFAAAAPASRQVGESPVETPRVSLFLKGDPDLAALDRLGVRLRTRVGDLWTADAPMAAVAGLTRVSGLTAAALGAPMITLLDSSLIAVNADSLRERAGDIWSGRTGEGVIVGIVDTGIDFTHEDFQRADWSTRILYLWDQEDNLGPAPGQDVLANGYGTEWTSQDIDNSSASVRARDKAGHGTRVAGVAAGNGRASDLEERRYTYAGMAPEADLIVVGLKALVTDTEIVDAVSYVFRRAEMLGKPAVVNLSLGTHFGPHDGTSSLEQALNGLAGEGRLLVAAAGNDGDDSIHAELHVPPFGSDSATVAVDAPAGVAVELLSVDAYCRRPDSLAVTVVSPAGKRFGPYHLGDEEDPGVLTGEGTLALVYQDVDPVGDNIEILLDLSDYNPSGSGAVPPPAKGLWRVVFTDLNGAPAGGEVDLWIPQRYPGSAQTHWRGHGYDPTEEVASPGTAQRVITVGSFNSKQCWTNPSDERQCTTAPGAVSQVGQITFFSSRGPTRDGRPKPEVCAPGFVVTSAVSHQMDPTLAALGLAQTMDPDGQHAVFAGTSIAAPHVTGALALLLETMPTITPEVAITRLRSSVRTDTFTGPGWSGAGGFGKLDVARLVDPDLVPVVERRFLVAAGEGGLPVLSWEALPEDPAVAFTLQRRDGTADWSDRAHFTGPGPHLWQERTPAPEGTRYRLLGRTRAGETIVWGERVWQGGSAARALVLAPPMSNPFRSGTEVAFHLDGTSGAVPLRATITDVAGRFVRLLGEAMTYGSGSVRWDGRDDRGNDVPAGVYWLTVEAGPFAKSVKLVRLP
jgi:subtilisin family serine protease